MPIRYKPGWEIEVLSLEHENLVYVSAPAICVHTKKHIRVSTSGRFKLDVPITQAIYETIVELELHEVHEHLRFEGELFILPHPV
jgi:hypothetical protein